MNNMKVHLMHAEVSAALERLSTLFKPGMKISFIARLPGNGEADVLIGDDHDADELIALVRRRFGASTVSASGALAAADDVEEVIDALRYSLQQAGTIAQDSLKPKQSSPDLRMQFKRIINCVRAGLSESNPRTAAQAATDKSED